MAAAGVGLDVLRIFQIVVLTVGAALSALPFVEYLLDVPDEQLGAELSSVVVGALLLFSPYVGLAVLGRRARPLAGYGALVILVALSVAFLAVAASDAQGGLVALYTLPLQWFVAMSVRAQRFATPG